MLGNIIRLLAVAAVFTVAVFVLLGLLHWIDSTFSRPLVKIILFCGVIGAFGLCQAVLLRFYQG